MEDHDPPPSAIFPLVLPSEEPSVMGHDLVENGPACFPSLKGTAVVLAQEWPSWAFVIGSLHPNRLVTYMDSYTPKTREEFRCTPVGTSWSRSWEHVQHLLQFSDDVTAWIQGDKGFVQRMREICKLHCIPRVTSVISRGEALPIGPPQPGAS